MEKVYFRYIPGIKHAYTFHMTTYSIYLTYTYSKLSATFRYQLRNGLVMEYTWYRCMSGIYCMSSYERYMHVLYQVYTGYILLIDIYIRCMLGISHIHVHMKPLTSMMSYTWYMSGIYH